MAVMSRTTRPEADATPWLLLCCFLCCSEAGRAGGLNRLLTTVQVQAGLRQYPSSHLVPRAPPFIACLPWSRWNRELQPEFALSRLKARRFQTVAGVMGVAGLALANHGRLSTPKTDWRGSTGLSDPRCWRLLPAAASRGLARLHINLEIHDSSRLRSRFWAAISLAMNWPPARVLLWKRPAC